ncbi:hypothetical protein KIW84_056520 [Lathyrus oleraceus]|uniref:Uncharacterized protein n=1 Tax=Pisum sativum TaxID=3888 RepID=A0A9D5AH03_PEA|nr:hypothetical protein KIW84_056520 [Pisum sativum]
MQKLGYKFVVQAKFLSRPPLVLWPMAYGPLGAVSNSRIVQNATKVYSPSTFVGLDVHSKIGVQIRCAGQVFVAPASRLVARSLWTTRPRFWCSRLSRPVARSISTTSLGRKSRIVRNVPKIYSPSKFGGIDVHAKIGIRKSRTVRNVPKIYSPSKFGGIDVHAKIGIKISCLGQGVVTPASRPVARGVSMISFDRKSRINRNAPKLCSPSTFGGIDIHAKIGIKICCLGQCVVAPASRPVARGVSTICSDRKSGIIRNASKLCSTSTFGGIDVHAKIGIKIHCLG